VEVGGAWTERPSILAAPALEDSAEKRSLLILKWFLLSLKHQFYIGGGEALKKPLNPFLGELFIADYMDGDATAHLVTEQISHHPPITAAYMWDEAHGIHGSGYFRVEMVFNSGFGSGTASGLGIDLRQYGHAIIHIDRFEEDYLIPAPRARVKGFLSGQLYPELIGASHIVSSSGFISEIQFSPLSKTGGWFKWPRFGGRDQRNLFNAIMYRRDDPKKTPLYSVAGQWSSAFSITHCDSGKLIETVDLSVGTPAVSAETLPPGEMDPWETRRAWKPVIKALGKGDMGETSRQKTKLENAQRDKRAVEERKGSTWEPLFFKLLQGDYELFEKLGSATAWPLEKDRTRGVWVVDEEKIQMMKRPFRPDSTPFG
jgi:oxysterol-binding protein-related protein 9/10/11